MFARSNLFRTLHNLLIALMVILFQAPSKAEEVVSLIDPTDAEEVWEFGNGPEFPGATGSLSLDSKVTRGENDSLKMVGDFTGGGGYVQAGREIDNIDIRELSLWLRSPIADRLTIRIMDASDQCHQIAMKVVPNDDWQQIRLPLERFFSRRGQADAPTGIVKYESWSGAKDGMWHGPAKSIYFLMANHRSNTVKTVWMSDITIETRPTAVAGAEVETVVNLDEIVEGSHGWKFSLGGEFAGAKGSLTVAPDQPSAGESCLQVEGDFNGGGAYVAAIRNLSDINIADVKAFRMRVKTENTTSVGIQLVDGSGQTHQRKDVPITADGKWHDFVLIPSEIAGGEHWGGANDGLWHGPARQMVVNLTRRSDPDKNQPVLLLADVRADVLRSVFLKSTAFRADFETDQLDSTWETSGDVAIDDKLTHKGKGSLAIIRSLEDQTKPTTVVGPKFAVVPGRWEVWLASNSDLNSPDNSYNGTVTLECLDASGAVSERFIVAEVFGRNDWNDSSKVVDIPSGADAARIRIQLNKTWGRLNVDQLSVAQLAPAPLREDTIDRILFSTVQLGNLLYPED